MNKRVLRLIHRWLAIPFGLIFLIICLSGAILVFEKDFGHIGQGYLKETGETPLGLDSILTITQKYLNGSNEIVGVTIYPEKHHAYKVMLAKPAMAALWVNQYDGKVLGHYKRAEIFKFASNAHRRLFCQPKGKHDKGAKIGKFFIGFTTIVSFFIIITGIMLWWPGKVERRNHHDFKRRKSYYSHVHNFHCLGGAFSSFVLVLCLLTGLTWSFGWYREIFYGTFGSVPPASSLHNIPSKNYKAWQAAYSELKEDYQNHEIRIYQDEIDVIENNFGNQQSSETFRYDAETGQIVNFVSYSEKEKAGKIKGWIYTLHVGGWLGWFTRTFYLTSVLIGALLPVTGYYLWIKKLLLKTSVTHI